MGLFYTTPEDLVNAEAMVLGLGQQIGLHSRGNSSPDVLREMSAETASALVEARDRLVAEGRQKDLRAWRKHLLSGGRYLDNAAYNRLYRPFLLEHLST